jgi:hypothetical protein
MGTSSWLNQFNLQIYWNSAGSAFAGVTPKLNRKQREAPAEGQSLGGSTGSEAEERAEPESEALREREDESAGCGGIGSGS